MGIPLPLAFNGAAAEQEGTGAAAWVAGAAIGLVESLDRFRRPQALPPVTGRQGATLQEMIRDYAAAASIGLGAMPPGPPQGPDPRLTLSLAAAGAFGAWQLVQLLNQYGPQLEKAGANVWNWLNRGSRGSVAGPLEGAPAGTILRYTLSPRRAWYYIRGTETRLIHPFNGGGTYTADIVNNGMWFNGGAYLIAQTAPRLVYLAPGEVWGYTIVQWRAEITGINSSGQTVTLHTEWYQGVVGTQNVRIYPEETNTDGWYTASNLIGMNTPYATPIQWDPAILPAWMGPPLPELPATSGQPWLTVSSPETAGDAEADPMEPQQLPLLPGFPGAVAVSPGSMATSGSDKRAYTPLIPATPTAYPLQISRPAKVRGFSPDGRQLPLPLEDVRTTPTDARQYGGTVITARGPRTDAAAVAEEVGRLEQKLGAIMPWLEELTGRPEISGPTLADQIREALLEQLVAQLIAALRPAVPATAYVFEAPCDRDEDDQPIQHVEEVGEAPFNEAVVERLDAIAAAMAETLQWRRRLCKGTAPRANVTVTAYEDV